jgi:hypothetical protein
MQLRLFRKGQRWASVRGYKNGNFLDDHMTDKQLLKKGDHPLIGLQCSIRNHNYNFINKSKVVPVHSMKAYGGGEL